MLTLIFMFLMATVFWKLASLAFTATWGMIKVLVSFVFLPVILVGLLVAGLVYIALPILVIVGIAAFLAVI